MISNKYLVRQPSSVHREDSQKRSPFSLEECIMPQGILWAVLQAPILNQIDPLYPNGSPHHITLQYGVDKADWVQWEGIEFSATLYEEVWNEHVQAILVKLPTEVPCQNSAPHITVSWAEGHSPAESNSMIEGLHWSRSLTWHESVPCRIEFFEWAIAPESSKQKASALQLLASVVHSSNKLCP